MAIEFSWLWVADLVGSTWWLLLGPLILLIVFVARSRRRLTCPAPSVRQENPLDSPYPKIKT
jgi:hypothetical protein